MIMEENVKSYQSNFSALSFLPEHRKEKIWKNRQNLTNNKKTAWKSKVWVSLTLKC